MPLDVDGLLMGDICMALLVEGGLVISNGPAIGEL